MKKQFSKTEMTELVIRDFQEESTDSIIFTIIMLLQVVESRLELEAEKHHKTTWAMMQATLDGQIADFKELEG